MKIYLPLICCAILLAGCSAAEEKAQGDAAEAMARQMEEGPLPDPERAGREAAKRFLTRQWPDSLQLHNELLEVKAIQSRYVLAGRKDDAAKFDTVFLSTLHTVNPELYREIKEAK